MTYFVLDQDRVVLAALEPCSRLESKITVLPIDSLPDISPPESPVLNVLIASRASLTEVQERHPFALERVSCHTTVVLALRRDQLIASVSMLADVSGWLFHDAGPSSFCTALKLIGRGYCTMPDSGAGVSDKPFAAMAAISTLSQVECVYLMELGKGRSTNLTSRHIGLSSVRARLVHGTILAKLHLDDAIEAGAFARRYESEITSHRGHSFKLENLG